ARRLLDPCDRILHEMVAPLSRPRSAVQVGALAGPTGRGDRRAALARNASRIAAQSDEDDVLANPRGCAAQTVATSGTGPGPTAHSRVREQFGGRLRPANPRSLWKGPSAGEISSLRNDADTSRSHRRNRP